MEVPRRSRGRKWTAREREHAKEYAEQFAEEGPHVLAARAGNPDGLRWLCEHTERARREAARFYLPGRPDQWPDAENVGWIGVVDALARWNVGAGIRFLDYAVHHIGNRVREFAQAHRSPVRRPAWLYRAYRKMERLVEEGLDWDEVVQRSGCSESSVASIVSVYREDISLHARPGGAGEEEDWSGLDLLPAPESEGKDRDWERKDRLLEMKMLLSQLDPQAQGVVRLSFGLDGEEGHPMGAREVAKQLGLTTKRVERILSNALQSMRLGLLRQERCYAIHPLPTGVGVHQLREFPSLEEEFAEEAE
ncbi:MAG: sigma-70 family RNA polymerase sigma factor [Methylacidiphilaceae bacterium]|nr:sigma-70 family RNA polymerase sigma factor [Candidatus Methylacidiphilaceae bacterium]